MTTHLSSMPQQPNTSTPSDISPGFRAPDVGPYAKPTDTLTEVAAAGARLDGIQATVGPYVPSLWRTRPVTSEAPTQPDVSDGEGEMSADLPWIDLFLDSEVTHMGAEEDLGEPMSEPWLTSEVDAPSIVDEAVVEDAMVAEVPSVDLSIVAAATEPDAADTADAWPLDEAGAAMRAFADDLDTRESESPRTRAMESTEPPVSSAAPLSPLPMWSDEDTMDIMPVKSAGAPTARGEEWAAQARREADLTGNSEATARALESLARRVRNGDIVMPGFAPDMGDAAALAAALAALLSVRR